MKKVFFIIIVCTCSVFQFSWQAKSQSQSSGRWIIIDGAGAGIQVVSDTPGGTKYNR